ncbi:MAG TPA: DUF4147 domain-containing protein [Gammaproteobacteria bacterium]|nr:DUF4147 domain-containing protein [Gammaproteobacteria bacterium]
MIELTARELLLNLYHSAIDAVDGRLLVNRWLSENSGRFTHCVAIGKAAPAMLQGALDQLPGLQHSLLICPPEKIDRRLKRNKNVTALPAAHPLPDESSLAAGRALLDFMRARQAGEHILFLISGGASAMVEVPADFISLEQLQQINRYLLASGKDIAQINAWRQRFSRIKGGGLLHHLEAEATQLLLSDVRDDRPELIGSGMLVAAFLQPDADDYLQAFLPPGWQRPAVPDKAVATHIIGNLETAKQAAADAAGQEGLPVTVYPDFIEGDACEAADFLYRQLLDAHAGVHIWGGETTVCLPDKPGVGGRNQSLALAFAEKVRDMPDLHLLAAGTDGVDGNSQNAGGVVCHYTVQKAEGLGFDIRQELDKANAGIVLMATDDVVRIDNCPTNVMDIMIAYKL